MHIIEPEREFTATEIREIQLSVLDQLIEFCESHSLTWHLWAGSLLGAVRHQGFIPWDDDIDVTMPRADYERLLRLAEDLPDDLRLASLRTSTEYPFAYAKLWRRGTVLRERYNPAPRHGVHVDIFPLDAWPASMPSRRATRMGLSLLRSLLGMRIFSTGLPRPRSRQLTGLAIRALLLPFRPEWFGRMLDALAAHSTDARSTSRVGVAVFSYMEEIDAAAYADITMLPFEGRPCPVPTGWADILTTLYGDYSELPPPEKRRSHHTFSAYAAS